MDNTSAFWKAVLLSLVLFSKTANCWHDLGNKEYDCWPYSQPNEFNMIDCGGLEMSWVHRPPEKVVSGQDFNVTYSVIASDTFYEYAVKNSIFKFSNASEAKKFCYERDCPENWKNANEDNCCIYHANIHSCPLAFMKQGGICGPWIPDDGKIVTHTISQAGKMSQENWTAKCLYDSMGANFGTRHVWKSHLLLRLHVNQTSRSLIIVKTNEQWRHANLSIGREYLLFHVYFEPTQSEGVFLYEETFQNLNIYMVVLFHLGVTSIIAHIKIGLMHAALEAKVSVLSPLVCGDDVCDPDEGCLTCPADCGTCPMSLGIKLAIGLPVAVFFTGFILTMVWFQYQKQKMFWDESWIISFKEIVIGKIDDDVGFGSITSLQKLNNLSNTSHVTDITVKTDKSTSPVQSCLEVGVYDGRSVAIRRLQKKHFTLSKSIRREVKEIRELDHPNLCKFIGGSIEVPNVAIVTEYCPKGSLTDVLLNEEVPLNWGFRLSFATDIARAMAYLHQYKIFHGRLHSKNCVIDDRWVCKISDYGLETYRKEDFEKSGSIFSRKFSRLYCAPEVLLGSSSNMTPAADIYSFSIILVEIATRSDLVSGDIDPVKTDITWRPPLPDFKLTKTDNYCPNEADYCELVKKCWNHSAPMRPTFEQIKKMLEKMNPHKVSPVDMMMNLMEKYSKHLEAIVAERTQDLLQEKQKTDRLLYSMLPKPVADELRQGRTLEAQTYSSATVYFSDIVGFTQLSSASTPHEVVDFLNKLYTTFDDIIDNYDVYKVETIGDAYMVVSGVPKVNGINHAGEIASMALGLVNVCETFKIPHKPNTQLKIRAGIHSGPVVAGVVGTKMPRYCLFGDTVNTASRMETLSEALKIQCSCNTAELLTKLGGYTLSCRGAVNVKGKGEMITWWLEGKIQSDERMKNCPPPEYC